MKPKVSICCQTYNHQDFIGDCIEGFLMQKTNFEFEILIHEDASTDDTASIIRKYQDKYPNRINCVFQTENQFNKLNSLTDILFTKATGKYIAICEGDDYWVDPNKLQKQVDFLEQNPQTSIVGHSIKTLDDNGNEDYWSVKEGSISFEDYLLKMKLYTVSLLFRNVIKKFPEDFYTYSAGDFYIKLSLLNIGDGYLMEEPMAVYRLHGNSMWSSKKTIDIHKKVLVSYRKLLKSFPKHKRAIKYATVKYKSKHKLFFVDINFYVFNDLIEVVRIGFNKLLKK